MNECPTNINKEKKGEKKIKEKVGENIKKKKNGKERKKQNGSMTNKWTDLI